MKKLFIMFLALMPLFWSCSDDISDDDIFTMYITWKGKEYVVPCTVNSKGKLVYLDEEFKALWDNEISKYENRGTLLTSENHITYYPTLDDMLDDLGLSFVDGEVDNEQKGGTRVVASDAIAGRVTLWKSKNFGGASISFQAYYTKYYSHHQLRHFNFNDEASSIKVWSDIPHNDSVYANWSEIETKYNEVPYKEKPTTGTTKYATNDLRVVFLGYQHKNYGGEYICIIPENQNLYSCYNLRNIGWNDRLSSLVIRLAKKNLYENHQ